MGVVIACCRRLLGAGQLEVVVAGCGRSRVLAIWSRCRVVPSRFFHLWWAGMVTMQTFGKDLHATMEPEPLSWRDY
jgi:hypothetical protein